MLLLNIKCCFVLHNIFELRVLELNTRRAHSLVDARCALVASAHSYETILSGITRAQSPSRAHPAAPRLTHGALRVEQRTRRMK